MNNTQTHPYTLLEDVHDARAWVRDSVTPNRHGRFRQSGVFREVFEEIVRRCLAAGLVEGRHLTVDRTFVQADASPLSRVPRELADVARLSRTVQVYLAEVEQHNPVVDPAEPPPPASRTVSTTDPIAAWAVKWGRAALERLQNFSGIYMGVDVRMLSEDVRAYFEGPREKPALILLVWPETSADL